MDVLAVVSVVVAAANNRIIGLPLMRMEGVEVVAGLIHVEVAGFLPLLLRFPPQRLHHVVVVVVVVFVYFLPFVVVLAFLLLSEFDRSYKINSPWWQDSIVQEASVI